MNKFLCVILAMCFSLFVFSCNNKSKYEGIYVADNNIQNSDTLILNADNTYDRRLYNKETNRLIFKQKGKWKIDGNDLNLENFFIDLDKKYGPDYNFRNGTINSHFKLREWKGKIYFKYGYLDEDKYTYFKK